MKNWTVSDGPEPNVFIIDIPYSKTKDWEAFSLLTSDRHSDNLYSDIKLQKKHLQEATDKGAPVIDYGDLYDAMQGKFDPRKDNHQLRPELVTNDYFDKVVDFCEEIYTPYKETIAILGMGNHEGSVLEHNQTNLSERLAKRLGVKTMGYMAWVKFRFKCDNSSERYSLNMIVYHGAGGSAPVTRGVIDTNRKAVWLDNADIIASGHNHQFWFVCIPRAGLTKECRTYVKDTIYLKSPGYKDTWQEQKDAMGWEKKQAFGPQAKGGWWLRFYYEKGRGVRVQPIPTTGG